MNGEGSRYDADLGETLNMIKRQLWKDRANIVHYYLYIYIYAKFEVSYYAVLLMNNLRKYMAVQLEMFSFITHTVRTEERVPEGQEVI